MYRFKHNWNSCCSTKQTYLSSGQRAWSDYIDAIIPAPSKAPCHLTYPLFLGRREVTRYQVEVYNFRGLQFIRLKTTTTTTKINAGLSSCFPVSI